jgi:hypothetical protein
MPGTFAVPGVDFACGFSGGEGYCEGSDLHDFSAEQKRGVPRLHGNMLPGNSFPQICVVSGTIIAAT